MILDRPAAARSRDREGGIDARHAFSFGRSHDPGWMGFGALRVLNEFSLAPGAACLPQRLANLEVLVRVLSGALAYRDAEGGAQVLRPGETLWIGAGHGVEHALANASRDAPAHFLEARIQPDRVNAAPASARRACDPPRRDGQWDVLAAPDGAGGALPIRQRARLQGARLRPGRRATVALDAGRRYWLHLAHGEADAGDRRLRAGDALGFVEASGELAVSGVEPAEVLLFDLPA